MADLPLRAGRLSPAERAEIERLAERGLTAPRIAQRLNRHKSTVNFAMTAMGLRAPTARTFAYTRGGHTVRSFSPDEDALIEALRCQRYTLTQIAGVCCKRFGHQRTPATIGIRLLMLSARELAHG